MPDFDGGHLFLTALVPVMTRAEATPEGGLETPAERLREVLSLMPAGGGASRSALSGSSVTDPRQSLFARDPRTHFARFAVIDALNYNGRVNGDALIETARGVDPLAPEAVDRLSRPYLLFAAEIDAPGDGAGALSSYLRALWTDAEAELRDIFRHCIAFAKVATADDFAAYIERCRVETTMPFNDYYAPSVELPAMRLLSPEVIGAALAVAGASIVVGVSGKRTRGGAAALGLATLIPLVGVAGLMWWTRVRLSRWAATPFPRAQGSDLPTILKALHLRQAFGAFLAEAQTLAPAELQQRFERFLDETKPSEPSPTQAPGVTC